MAIICSKCNSKRIEIREDKDKVLGYAFTNPIYAKLYICKDCAHTWNEEDEKNKPKE